MWRMIRDRAVNMNSVNLWVFEKLVVVCVAHGNIKLVSDLVHLSLVAATDCDEVDIWMRLMNGDELGSENRAQLLLDCRCLLP